MSGSAGQPSPWAWIPTLYFAQGLPYVAVMTLSVVMYKNLGLSNTDIALYTSWLYLPWVIKPLWSPLVELTGSARAWLLAMQLCIGAGFAAIGLTLPGDDYLRATLAAFWLLAFASSTHDIAADGFYMQALSERKQAAFVGIRSTFYRCAMIFGQGGLVWLAGWRHGQSGDHADAWAGVFALLAAGFVVFAGYHALAAPRPAQAKLQSWRHGAKGAMAALRAFGSVFVGFFARPGIGAVLAFLLLYRFPEAQLLKLATPFLLDAPADGGLGLTTQQVGIVYGTVGVAALTLGGILGGLVIARTGLRRALWPLVLCVHLPNLVFVALAWAQPQALWLVGLALAVEQFGYGFGFTAYMMYMIHVSQGPHQTAHYAICTGFMALGMMLPGLWSGWLQDQLGYVNFFLWIVLAALPSLWAVARVDIPAEFGRRE